MAKYHKIKVFHELLLIYLQSDIEKNLSQQYN